MIRDRITHEMMMMQIREEGRGGEVVETIRQRGGVMTQSQGEEVVVRVKSLMGNIKDQMAHLREDRDEVEGVIRDQEVGEEVREVQGEGNVVEL